MVLDRCLLRRMSLVYETRGWVQEMGKWVFLGFLYIGWVCGPVSHEVFSFCTSGVSIKSNYHSYTIKFIVLASLFTSSVTCRLRRWVRNAYCAQNSSIRTQNQKIAHQYFKHKITLLSLRDQKLLYKNKNTLLQRNKRWSKALWANKYTPAHTLKALAHRGTEAALHRSSAGRQERSLLSCEHTTRHWFDSRRSGATVQSLLGLGERLTASLYAYDFNMDKEVTSNLLGD